MTYFSTLKEQCLSIITNPEGRDTFVAHYSEISQDLMSALILYNRYESWTALKNDWRALSDYVIKTPYHLSHFEITSAELLELSEHGVDLSHVRSVFLEKYDEKIVDLIPKTASVKLVAKNFELEQIRFIPHDKYIDFSQCNWLKVNMFQSLSNVVEMYIYPSFLCEALFTADFFKTLQRIKFIEFEEAVVEDQQENEVRIYDPDSLLKFVYNPILNALNLNQLQLFWKVEGAQSAFIQKLEEPLHHISFLHLENLDLEDEILKFFLSKFRQLRTIIIKNVSHFTVDRICAFCRVNPNLNHLGIVAPEDARLGDELFEIMVANPDIKNLYLKSVVIEISSDSLSLPPKLAHPVTLCLSDVSVNSYRALLAYFQNRMIPLCHFSDLVLSTEDTEMLLCQSNIQVLILSNVSFKKTPHFVGFKKSTISEVSIIDPKGLNNNDMQSLILTNPEYIHLNLTEDSHINYRFIDGFYNSEESLEYETTLILEVQPSFWDGDLESREAFYGQHCLKRNLEIVIKE